MENNNPVDTFSDNKPRYAIYSIIGVYWDGGVRRVGTYRWRWVAKIRCWYHAAIENPYRVACLVETNQDVDWFNSTEEFVSWRKKQLVNKVD